MFWKTINQEKRLYFIAAVILLIGLASSLLIYLTAENNPGAALGYVMIDGQAHPIMPEDSKMYRHDLQVYGGKFGVAADEFTRWFNSLWHGQTLAYTVAVIALLISLSICFVARTSPPDQKT